MTLAQAQTPSNPSKYKRKKNKQRAKKERRRTGRTLASQADKFLCYQKSVQDPPFEVRILKRVFKDAYGRAALTLREDFCGAGAVACEWARQKGAESWGVDLDSAVLQWGLENNLTQLKPSQQERVHLLEGDVRTAKTPKVDIVAAENFSYFIFKTRPELLAYFKAARKNLKDEGVLLLDMLGGPEVQEDEEEEEREVDDADFTYVWEQARYNPIANNALFHIHFEFQDGSRIKKAFTYDWRMWTIPEVRELLTEAGFSSTTVYWEKSDEDGDGNGHFYKTEKAPADLTWLCYIAAKK